MPSEDEYPATSTTWSTELIHPSPHLSVPSSYRRSFVCRRWKTTMETRTLWITWNLLRPWCTFRGPRMIMCRAFPTTLKGPIRIWFSKLTPNSISSFKELSAQFTSHFIRGHRYKMSTACLMNIKQQEDETLRSYITHFNKEALSNDEANNKIRVPAFTNWLQKGKFLFSLYKNDLKTMYNVLYMATKYMNAEDALLTWEDKPRKRERQDDTRQDKGRKMARTGERREDRCSKPPTGKFTSFTPLTAPID